MSPYERRQQHRRMNLVDWYIIKSNELWKGMTS